MRKFHIESRLKYNVKLHVHSDKEVEITGFKKMKLWDPENNQPRNHFARGFGSANHFRFFSTTTLGTLMINDNNAI